MTHEWHLVRVPAMLPGKRSRLALSQSDSLIQLPSWLFTPPGGIGTVSRWFLVTITVLLSTLATSFGSVRASQLPSRETVSAVQKMGLETYCSSQPDSPVFIFGKPLDHAVPLQTCQDVGRFLRGAGHHVDIGGFALVRSSLHKIRHRWR